MDALPRMVLAIGASQNIGYYTTLRLLERGSHVTYLLRDPARFDLDPAMQPHIKAGRVRLVKGDALVEEDVRRVWSEALDEDGTLDLILSTIGSTNRTFGLSGVTIHPPNICSASMLNLLSTMPAALRQPGRQPKLIVLSSTGVGKAALAALPFPHSFLYPLALGNPARDKLALERVVAHASGGAWFDAVDARATDELVGGDWATRAGPAGAFTNVVVVRPAFLVDGETTGVYRTDPLGAGFKSIRRKDVAHFIFEDVLQNWDERRGKAIGVGY